MARDLQLVAPAYLVLIVSDLERALAFYTDVLGLRLGHRSGPYAQLDTATTRIALFERQAMQQTLGFKLAPAAENAPAFEIGFKVDDVDTVYAELIGRGVIPVTPPTDRPWGQRTAYLRDPDGNLIELVQDPPA